MPSGEHAQWAIESFQIQNLTSHLRVTLFVSGGYVLIKYSYGYEEDHNAFITLLQFTLWVNCGLHYFVGLLLFYNLFFLLPFFLYRALHLCMSTSLHLQVR